MPFGDLGHVRFCAAVRDEQTFGGLAEMTAPDP